MRRRIHALIAIASIGAACRGGEIGDPSGDGVGNPAGKPGSSGSGGGAGTGGSSGPFIASDSEARRLSQAEYDNTLRDLIGETARPATQYLPEDQFTPYDNDYGLQDASRALVEALDIMAGDVAGRWIADPTRRALIVPCTPTGPGDTDCFRKSVETFGRRALRRPLVQAEIDAYMSLQSFATENNPYVAHDFYTGIALVLRSILQDPEFLYRIEVGSPDGAGGVAVLSDWELATRMSYLVWGSTPDDPLLEDAGAHRLSTPDGRKVAAERLLSDDRAKGQLHRFHAMWLGYRTIPQTAELAAKFDQETTALIDRSVFDGTRGYLDLFLSKDTYLDDALADHYQMPHPSNGGGAGWVTYTDPARAGILAHGSVLSAFSKFTDTSPTQRGILVRNRLMCETILPPPAVVDVDKPPGAGSAACKKDRYLEHSASAGCSGCHSRMDPIGFGLEKYDMGGRLRDHDDGHPECPIDGLGDLPGYGSFSGPRELEEKLVDAGVLDRCVVSQYYAFAIGRALAAGDAAEIEQLTRSFQESGFAFTKLLTDYVESEPFARKKEPDN